MHSVQVVGCGCNVYTYICGSAAAARHSQSRLHLCPGSTSARVLQAAGDPGRYQNTDWAAAFTSQLQEYDYWVTEVEGTVPDTLRGTLFRNGPGR